MWKVRGPAQAVTVAAIAALAGCGSYTEYYPFHPSVGGGAEAVAPRGVSLSSRLRGVAHNPTDGVPSRHYELTIEVDQPAGQQPRWEPIELAHTEVRDDEGNAFRAAEVLISGPTRARTTAYLVTYPVRPAYRFASIGRAKVVWRLRAANHPPISITETFRNRPDG